MTAHDTCKKKHPYQDSQQVEILIHDAMDALTNTIRDNRIHELPTLTNKTDAYHPTSTTSQQSVEKSIWSTLMTIKQMHDLVRLNLIMNRIRKNNV